MLLGFCGLDCEECPVYIATANDDDELRSKTALEWSKLYGEYMGGKELSIEDMNCGGCKGEQEDCFIGCTMCPIRTCSESKLFVTCADCGEYETCEMLKGFYTVNPQAKSNLDDIQRNR